MIKLLSFRMAIPLFVTVCLLFQGCDIDGEPPEPSYKTIQKRHLSHVPDAKITNSKREGNFVTYYGSRKYRDYGSAYVQPVSPRYITVRYIIVYELIDGVWVHISSSKH